MENYDAVEVPRDALTELLGLVQLAIEEKGDWRGALNDAEYTLTTLLA
jgi:hypothetical protein